MVVSVASQLTLDTAHLQPGAVWIVWADGDSAALMRALSVEASWSPFDSAVGAVFGASGEASAQCHAHVLGASVPSVGHQFRGRAVELSGQIQFAGPATPP